MDGLRLRGRGGCVVVIVSLFDTWGWVVARSANELVVNRDDYVSRWRNTNFSREEALRQIL